MLNFRLNAKPEQILLSEVLTKLATFYFIPRSLQVVTEFSRFFFDKSMLIHSIKA